MPESGKNRKKAEVDCTEQTVVALLTSPSLEEASKHLGITSRTLRTWLHEDAALRHAYYEAKRAIMAHALSRMQRITAKAVTTLERVMDNPRAPSASRVAAAKTVIDIALKAVTLEDLEQRLSRIEGELQKRKETDR
jgi:hypothetical protein